MCCGKAAKLVARRLEYPSSHAEGNDFICGFVIKSSDAEDEA